HPVGRTLTRELHALEDLLCLPELENLTLELVGAAARREHCVSRLRSRIGHGRSSTPSISSASAALVAPPPAPRRPPPAPGSGDRTASTTASPSTRMPPWTPTIVSGTIAGPTTSAPAVRSILHSASVGREGPGTAA